MSFITHNNPGEQKVSKSVFVKMEQHEGEQMAILGQTSQTCNIIQPKLVRDFWLTADGGSEQAVTM